MDNPGMFFTLRHPTNACEITVKVQEDATITEALSAFRSFLLACGYAESVVSRKLDGDGQA